MQSDFVLGVIGFNGGEMGRQTKGKPSADQIVVSPLFMIITSCNGMNCFVFFFFFFLRSKKQNKRPPPSKREQEKTLQKNKRRSAENKRKTKQNGKKKKRDPKDEDGLIYTVEALCALANVIVINGTSAGAPGTQQTRRCSTPVGCWPRSAEARPSSAASTERFRPGG